MPPKGSSKKGAKGKTAKRRTRITAAVTNDHSEEETPQHGEHTVPPDAQDSPDENNPARASK